MNFLISYLLDHIVFKLHVHLGCPQLLQFSLFKNSFFTKLFIAIEECSASVFGYSSELIVLMSLFIFSEGTKYF